MASRKINTQSHKKYSKISLKVNVMSFRSAKRLLSSSLTRLSLSPKFPKNLASNSQLRSLSCGIIAKVASFSTKIWEHGAKQRRKLIISVNLHPKFQLLLQTKESKQQKQRTKKTYQSPPASQINKLSLICTTHSSVITLAFRIIICSKISFDV